MEKQHREIRKKPSDKNLEEESEVIKIGSTQERTKLVKEADLGQVRNHGLIIITKLSMVIHVGYNLVPSNRTLK